MKKQYLEIGKIVNTHGIAGEVKLMPWCDSPDFATEFDTLFLNNGKEKLNVLEARVHKGMVILKLEHINNMDDAVKLRNNIVYVNRNDIELEDDCYFIQDLIGVKVYDIDTNVCYGEIIDVLQTGANDVYTVKDEKGIERLIPAIADVVIETDIENDKMLIRPLKGLFDDEN